MRASVRVRDVFVINENNILPRLIMIIIKIKMFRYFIEIAHTDDFPSTGTRLVLLIPANTSLQRTVDYAKRKIA